jgi:hypothetical protein
MEHCKFCKSKDITFYDFEKDIKCCTDCLNNLSECDMDKEECQYIIKYSKQMRKLWTDHIIYTREYILSVHHNCNNVPHVLERLLKNQEDLGYFIGGFYNDVSMNLITLLKEHIMGAGKIVDAVKNKKNSKNLINDWYENAKQISQFLHDLNPDNWSLEDLNDAMRKHLDDTLSEASNILKSEFKKSFDDFDNIHYHILNMADLFSKGIINQFPENFQ